MKKKSFCSNVPTVFWKSLKSLILHHKCSILFLSSQKKREFVSSQKRESSCPHKKNLTTSYLIPGLKLVEGLLVYSMAIEKKNPTPHGLKQWYSGEWLSLATYLNFGVFCHSMHNAALSVLVQYVLMHISKSRNKMLEVYLLLFFFGFFFSLYMSDWKWLFNHLEALYF
jgi:hypothetical protein